MKFPICDNCGCEIFYISDMVEHDEYRFCNKACKIEFIEACLNCDDIDKFDEYEGRGMTEK